MDLADYARDNATSDLISSGNYKQALKTVEKKLRKSADDSLTLALKANLLLRLGDFAGSKSIIRQVVGHKPPIVDHVTLELAYSGLCELRRLAGDFDEQEVESLWQNAIKAQQNPKWKIQLARRWASQSIHHGEWQQLIKAAMALQKFSDQATLAKRNYWYWQTTARYLASQSASPDRIRSVHRDLVGKMLEKAASDTPHSVKEPPEDLGLWIATPQELKLLIEVFAREGRHRELVSTLETKKFQIIAGNDYAFDIVKSCSLIALGDDVATWTWANAAVEDATRLRQQWLLDDWRVWSGLIKITKASNAQGLPFAEDSDRKSALAACKTLLEGYKTPNTLSRAPQQAALALLWSRSNSDFVEQQRTKDMFLEPTIAGKLLICQSHFERYFDQFFVLDDLEDKLRTLNANELALFRERALSHVKNEARKPIPSERDQIRWLVAETNALRIDHEILLRGLREDKHQLQTAVSSVFGGFVLSCLRLYRVSRTHIARFPATDAKPGDYLGILAAKALKKLYSEYHVVGASFQALCLLESLVAASGSNFEARIELVSLLTDHGLHLLAWESFRKLDVKEILNESLSPLFFAGISTVNPQSASSFDAREAMEKPLGFYERAISKIPKYQELALDSQNYAHMIHMEDLARQIKDSATRWMLGLERRRIARIRGLQYDHIDALFGQYLSCLRFDDGCSCLSHAVTHAIERNPLKCPKAMNYQNLSMKSRYYAEFKLGRGGCEPYIAYLGYVDSLSEAVHGISDPQRAQQVLDTLSDSHLKKTLLASYSAEAVECALAPFLIALAALVEVVGRAQTDLSTITEKIDLLANMIDHYWQDRDVQFWRSHCREHVVPRDTFYNSCYNGLEFLQLCHKAADKVLLFVNAKTLREQARQKTQCLEGARRIQATAKERSELIFKVVRQARAQLPPKDGIVEVLFGSTDRKVGSDIGEVVMDIVGHDSARLMLLAYVEAARKSLEGILRVKVG